jgi:riboflavin synthase
MFTGIISHLGVFKNYGRGKQEMLIGAPTLAAQIEPGDSLAVNGVCLTLVRKEAKGLVFNLSQETLGISNLGLLRPGEELNLELPISLQTPLSGHLVAGHIDGRGKVLKSIPRKPGRRLAISFPVRLRPFFIPKGSVAINGVSLTLAGLGPSSLEVEIIPITLKNSNLGSLKSGDEVNIECDMIGKYVYNRVVPSSRRA